MTQFNYNYNTTNTPNYNFADFVRKHRILAVVIIIVIVALLGILILYFSQKSPAADPYANRVPEKAPIINIEHKYLIEYSTYEKLSKKIIYDISNVLIREDEIASAPQDNPDGNNYIASVEEISYQVTDLNANTKVYTMNLNLSDSRRYTLRIYFDSTYQKEAAVAVLTRLDQPDAKSYVITYTGYTPEYYANLGKDNTSSSDSSSSSDNPDSSSDNSTADPSAITDYITGRPLQPLPQSAENWINSLHLTNPEIIHSTLPGIR